MMTEIGKLLRTLRIDRDERLLDMAAKLGVSPSFLSAVEKGHKSPPADIEETVIELYRLAAEDADKLRSAAYRSREAFTLKPKSDLERDTVGLLARRMGSLSLSQADLEQIQGILRKREKP